MIRFRLLFMFAAVVLIFYIFSPPTFAVATQCQIHKNSEWRCAKDNYRADKIKITNRRDERVSFKIAKWNSTCGKQGSNYSDTSYSLKPRQSGSIKFESAAANQCKELFVYDCSPDWCTNILSVNPS
ncbi:hypothetical protein [Calothrix sp. UHCC 0171]|uniref:hypothetical protein n=1 Tax=Calothrix sp. UHCC 0171 TaxID=3110245 RepID=UPI002B1F0C96|nr:hypothetical protein [Calothrix sp. UHCC 0171]MEA5572978.1 hypothetical protein [Calothrix sp. UHCC 0171]